MERIATNCQLSELGSHTEGSVSRIQADQRPLIRKKIIIDTDPGIDDAVAILMAFQSLELEVIGLTTIFGNVITPVATRNALHLCEAAGFVDVPVAEGCFGPLKGGHYCPREYGFGSDGLGNTYHAKSRNTKIDKSAAEFLVEKVRDFPNEITVVAMGPLTNLAEAMRKDKSFASNVEKLIVLGGSFFATGNMNPAAEFNILCDPEAADLVVTSGAKVFVIGINLTTRIIFTEADLCEIRDSKGRNAKSIYDMCSFNKVWNMQSDGFEGVFLHDPTCIAAVLQPNLFTYKQGALRVETQGICTGHTILDLGLKIWGGSNPWTNQPLVSVGWAVNAQGVAELVKERLKRPWQISSFCAE